MSGYTRWEESGFVLHMGLGKSPAGELKANERPPPYAEARSRAKNEKLWEGPLTAPGDSVHIGIDRTAYAHGVIAAVYPELGGPTRVRARSEVGRSALGADAA